MPSQKFTTASHRRNILHKDASKSLLSLHSSQVTFHSSQAIHYSVLRSSTTHLSPFGLDPVAMLSFVRLSPVLRVQRQVIKSTLLSSTKPQQLNRTVSSFQHRQHSGTTTASDAQLPFKHVYHDNHNCDLLHAISEGDKVHVHKLLRAFVFTENALDVASKESAKSVSISAADTVASTFLVCVSSSIIFGGAFGAFDFNQVVATSLCGLPFIMAIKPFVDYSDYQSRKCIDTDLRLTVLGSQFHSSKSNCQQPTASNQATKSE